MKIKIALAIIISAMIIVSCTNKNEKMEKELRDFIVYYDSVIQPLYKEMALAYWQASITGKDEDFAKYEKLDKEQTQFHSNKENFNKIKNIKDNFKSDDSLLMRQTEAIYIAFLSNQADTNLLKEIIEMETTVEKKFNNFRAKVDGKELTDNKIEEILSKSTNNKELQAVWEAHKKIGSLVAEDVKELVKKRNQVAKELGFKNFHEMSLSLNEQKPEEIEAIFDELDTLTSKSFANLKKDVDDYLSARVKLKPEELMPWHYQNRFFQEAPKIYKVDLDKYYSDKNLEKLTTDYYKSMNMPVEDIIARSDLYEKPGKSQHAFCTDIDNSGDVRILCNIKPNLQWMNTMLHEFGHGIYDKYIDLQLPYVLRQPAHIFATEAIAMMFGRMSSTPQWIQDMTGISDKEKEEIAEASLKSLRLEELVFSRWAQVMYRFEKGMYENPDQDLNQLWWTLVEKYQMIKKPEGRNEPDWASKIHVATVPCYYHNYMLGSLLASQLSYYVCDNVLKGSVKPGNTSFFNKPEVGEYFKSKVFAPGAKYYWNEMIEKATGEKLTAKYYAKQFVIE